MPKSSAGALSVLKITAALAAIVVLGTLAWLRDSPPVIEPAADIRPADQATHARPADDAAPPAESPASTNAASTSPPATTVGQTQPTEFASPSEPPLAGRVPDPHGPAIAATPGFAQSSDKVGIPVSQLTANESRARTVQQNSEPAPAEQSPADTKALSPAALARIRNAVAEDATLPRTADLVESALQTAAEQIAKAGDSVTPLRTAGTATAMGRLLAAFTTEINSEQRQNLLSAAGDLAASTGEPMQGMLTLATQKNQPIEVQRQAIYLAGQSDPNFLKTIAADASNPLHEDAEAFLLEMQLARGVRPPPKEETPPPLPPTATN